MASVAAAIAIDGDTVKRANLVLHWVAPVPYRARPVEEYLSNTPASGIDPAHAGSLTLPDHRPMAGNNSKVAPAANLVKRAVARLLDR